MLEELNCALVRFRSGTRFERTEVLSSLRLGIDLARIQTVLAARKLADHAES